MQHDFVDASGRLKSKSPHRMVYEAQVQVIQKQIGNLEQIREVLGLSQRKISQLLLVDPSAWTRWTKLGDRVPPHIFRALQWYMIIQEKIPGLTPSYFIGKDISGSGRAAAEMVHQKTMSQVASTLGAEAAKRAEFEEAYAIQALKLEEMIQSLVGENSALEKQVLELRAAIKHNRAVFAVSALSMVIVGISFALAFYWCYPR